MNTHWCTPLLLTVSLLACTANEPEEAGTSTGANYVLGCRTATRCVTASGGGDVISDEAKDRAACETSGGTVLMSESCPPAPGGGCCHTIRGNARVTTCVFDGDPNDPASVEGSCVASGGTWDTVDRSGENHDTPASPATFVTGCDFAARSDLPGGRHCVLYDESHLGQSCKEPLGVAVTSCPSDGLLGCCRLKGPILSCRYAGEGISLDGVQTECAMQGGAWRDSP